MIEQLYIDLPERVFNKKQNIKKKAWVQNINKELDKIYFNKLKYNLKSIFYILIKLDLLKYLNKFIIKWESSFDEYVRFFKFCHINFC